MRSLWSLPILMALVTLPTPLAHAGHATRLLTREGNSNAIVLQGQTYTLAELVARRDLNPARFDHFHPRLGHALALGEEGLLARRAINPSRFDRFHPFISYLLRKPPINQGPGSSGQPDPPTDRPPVVIPPPTTIVPEPTSLALLATGLTILGWCVLHRRVKA